MAMQGKNEVDRLLADSIKELAAKRPVEKITIKEITDISRWKPASGHET